jgi:general nucleoside transport system permease protein
MNPFVLFAATIRTATPLFITAIGGIFSERAGIINIALEGMMLSGAFVAAVVCYLTGSPWAGVLGAMMAGAFMGFLHAVMCIRYRSNQVVSGVALNMLASGTTVFLLQIIWGVKGTSPNVATIPSLAASLGVRQESFLYSLFDYSPLVLIGLFVVFAAHIIFTKTVFGLRLKAVGEHPMAADTLGIKVHLMQYIGVIISGILAGLAGAYLSVGQVGLFRKDMSAGRGFIALAALIPGKWNPVGAFLASLLFGFAEALQFTLSGEGWLASLLPQQLLQMLPYLLTMVMLAGLIGHSVAPKHLGKPYVKEEK